MMTGKASPFLYNGVEYNEQSQIVSYSYINLIFLIYIF